MEDRSAAREGIVPRGPTQAFPFMQLGPMSRAPERFFALGIILDINRGLVVAQVLEITFVRASASCSQGVLQFSRGFPEEFDFGWNEAVGVSLSAPPIKGWSCPSKGISPVTLSGCPDPTQSGFRRHFVFGIGEGFAANYEPDCSRCPP